MEIPSLFFLSLESLHPIPTISTVFYPLPPIPMDEAKKTWTIFRVYLLIASIVGLIGGLISLGIALTSLAQRLIITDNEYVKGQNYYQLDQCKQGYYYGKTAPTDATRKPSAEEQKTCEQTQTENLLLSRNVNTKMSVLGGGIRAILFAVLFFTHYPRFRKQNNA